MASTSLGAAHNSVLLLACALALLASSVAYADVVEHSFHVQNLTLQRLCSERVVTAVNGSLPGPLILARDGDTLVIHVFNKSPYNLTIHWHGIFQLMSGWADGPDHVTQCPIRPGNSYTYRFNITGQEGTLWWHAHFQWLRATVYGALVIRPRRGHSYPFAKPYKEVPILIGEWWNANVIDVENEALATGGAPNSSDAYTINGLPGHLYPCSSNSIYKLKVERGKTYLLRIINAALNIPHFFKIANHRMTVVAIDASYTEPYVTDVVVIAPGQTTDVLLTADRPPVAYYMAASPYQSIPGFLNYDNTTTTGLIVYEGATSSDPLMPVQPAFNDTPTAHRFFTNLTGLANGPQWVPVPLNVDEHMFVTFGLGLIRCDANETCEGLLNQSRFAASMNNVSFQNPTTTSLLEAFFGNEEGVYTADFPDRPPLEFDYTNISNAVNESIIWTSKSTRVKRVKFNATVEMVLQNTAFLGIENHPMHLHGFNFHILAQGFGNYDPINDPQRFNFVNPQIRNTIAVPVGGWAVIRFQANNPGMWLMHCHFDVHLPWGLSMAFEVENGPTPSTMLPPPPPDLPQC